ncbi:MAG TPA: error-prone DNA polymerase, partial [Alphaproteobacteria bacterium]|nr:error-prone DNA polymerase [Alphaproteobacteria bacterium]
MSAYAELQILSNFTFLQGASHPEEHALAAAALGYSAFALTDRNSLAGVVRAHLAAKQAGIRFLVGTQLDLARDLAPYERKPLDRERRPRLPDGLSLLAYPADRPAYARLSRLISRGRRRAPKGACWLTLADLEEFGEGLLLALLPESIPPEQDPDEILADLRRRFGRNLYLATHPRFSGRDTIAGEAALAARHRVPLLATNAATMHAPNRKPLADVLACVRERTTIDRAGYRLAAHAERHLKAPAEMHRLFRDQPQAIANALEIVERCTFSLEELRYEYPAEILVAGETPQQTLARLTWEGAARRYPEGVPEAIRDTLHRELALIAELGYAPYFLTVYDVVRFARSQEILCQGRGSAANSAVCYCLGVTAVDPARVDLLFERFVSAARNEPPDIDVDFEHERREEVIQYIYRRYGRHRAGLTATVVTYRARGAVRDVGKAMGLSSDTVGVIASNLWGWHDTGITPERVAEAGLDPNDRRIIQTLTLAKELLGFPRHLSQHTGGFVIARDSLEALVPVENASMADRTVIEWDKDDIDALGILKVDVLALGMLTCARKSFDLLRHHYGRELGLADIPEGDEATYEMLSRADSLGTFQVESRAQMSMLARLKPRCFYDLVIEVAIVRPGPIQGDMVHPYLRRREGKEPVAFPSKDLERVLGKTLGVPLFQEQAMKIAIVAAGFTPEEADRLRRAMATFKKHGDVSKFYDKMVEGMTARGYDREFAERCFRQIEGFGTYGFPESHAASFALLVYVSSWIKCHYPEAFAAALLNSQPLGFYAPAQIVRDAVEHGVRVLPADVNASDWDCTLEPGAGPGPACGSIGWGVTASPPARTLRLGLRQIKGLAEADVRRLVACRGNGYASVQEMRERTGLGPAVLERLAEADAFASLGLSRREALWAVRALPPEPLPLFAAAADRGGEHQEEPAVQLPEASLGEQVAEDYRRQRLSLRRHPMALLRPRLAAAGAVPHARLADLPNGSPVRVAGLVLVRQRPGSAKGVIFATLEDETGIANIIVWPKVFETYRAPLTRARLLEAEGRLQKQGLVIHVVAERLEDGSQMLSALDSADAASMQPALARADEIARPQGEDRRFPIKSRDF